MIDQAPITAAILETSASPYAREEGERLMLAYCEQYADDFQRFRILDVERPWHLWLDEWTLLVGCKDTEFDDGQSTPLMGEWKTRKAPDRTKAGTYYKGQSPDDWLAGISNGPQLGIYALHKVETSGAEYARIMVRAAVKSIPVELWPPNEADGIFILNREYLMHLKNALLVRASEIRTARLSGLTPWDWVGYKCTHMYGKTCVFYEQFCKEHQHPQGRLRAFNVEDPGYAGVKGALAERGWDEDRLHEPKLVILSASAYDDYSQCRERGRIIQDGLAAGDDSMELQIGSCFHAGVAAWYRELQREQNVSNPIPVATADTT